MNTNTPALDDHLVAASISVIRRGQAASGAYVASPTFSQYGYGWLRDGAYIALAMDAVGDHESSARFHHWVASVLLAQRGRIATVLEGLAAGRAAAELPVLPARYELDGADEDNPEQWPNFQLDGYGTWLFGLHQHSRGPLDEHHRAAAELSADYLVGAWRSPCYDYWEEFGDRQHTSTLAAIAAGLRAAAQMLERPDYAAAAAEVVEFIGDSCVVDGSFVKGPNDHRVDASLVSLSTPFGIIASDDTRMKVTIARLRNELRSPSGGLRRYVGDTYFGGSPWILLTAWLGWHDRLSSDEEGAQFARKWVRQRAAEDGSLAEQDVREPQAPHMVAEWEERWGTIADPLLWSHAKYLLLEFGGEAPTWS